MTFQDTVADDSPRLLPNVATFLGEIEAVKFERCCKEERRGIELTGDDSSHHCSFGWCRRS
jgi:hypothetical protein